METNNPPQEATGMRYQAVPGMNDREYTRFDELYPNTELPKEKIRIKDIPIRMTDEIRSNRLEVLPDLLEHLVKQRSGLSVEVLKELGAIAKEARAADRKDTDRLKAIRQKALDLIGELEPGQ